MAGCVFNCFVFNDTATTEIYTYGHTLSLHDALPICHAQRRRNEEAARLPPDGYDACWQEGEQELEGVAHLDGDGARVVGRIDRSGDDDGVDPVRIDAQQAGLGKVAHFLLDRKSTRLNYSH